MTTTQFLTEADGLRSLLFAFAVRLTNNRHDAEDLVQETLLRGYRSLGNFQDGTHFKSWLTTIMRNTFINDYRKRVKRYHINNALADEQVETTAVGYVDTSGEDNLYYGELTRVLRSIGELYSVPFLLFHQGYEYQEIADQLGLPIGTVKSRIFTARTRMKALIQQRQLV